MKAFWAWMAGRKTYLLAGGVMLVVLILVGLGHLTVQTAAGVLLFAVAGFGATFRSALGRHQAQELAILEQLAAAGTAYRKGDVDAARVAGFHAGWDGLQLVRQVAEEEKSAETAGQGQGV